MEIRPLSMPKPPASQGGRGALRLSTNDIPRSERTGWLRDVICREYANVEVTSPARQVLSQDLTIYPWDSLRLSIIRSSGIALERLPREPQLISQDAYFAVILLSGDYVLQPGDITIYDATRPHRINCPRDFAKLILSIPRPVFRARIAGVEHCTVRHISGADGIGAVASNFVRSSSRHASQFTPHEFSALADHALDLLTLAAASVRPTAFALSRSRANSSHQVSY
jgi:AraC family transcriptional activator of tynA and feaB